MVCDSISNLLKYDMGLLQNTENMSSSCLQNDLVSKAEIKMPTTTIYKIF